jgi:hypothetical protein
MGSSFHRPRIVTALVLVQLLAALGAVQAATVWGQVVSADRTPADGARVYLQEIATGSVFQSEVTRRGGDYSVQDLPAGTYQGYVVTQTGAYLGTGTIDASATSSVVVDFTLGLPASGEALPTAEQFPGLLSVPAAGYARSSVGTPERKKSSKAKAGIVVGATAGGIAVLALAISAIDDNDDEPAATEILP